MLLARIIFRIQARWVYMTWIPVKNWSGEYAGLIERAACKGRKMMDTGNAKKGWRQANG